VAGWVSKWLVRIEACSQKEWAFVFAIDDLRFAPMDMRVVRSELQSEINMMVLELARGLAVIG